MKKLYIVPFSGNMIVLATNKDEALLIAGKNIDSDIDVMKCNGELFGKPKRLKDIQDLPENCDGAELPWTIDNSEEELTITELLELN